MTGGVSLLLTDASIRERVFPQMVHYDRMPPGRIVPFAMLAGPANHRSDVVNTDANGFRWTTSGASVQTTETLHGLKDAGIVVGGSTVFGVGSTTDATTLPSFLAARQGTPWLNLGVRGGVSFQEYIHTTRFLHQVDSVRSLVLFSGVNDTYINLLHDHDSEFDRRFEEQNSLLGFYNWKRQALSSAMSAVSRFEAEELVALPVSRILSAPFRRSERLPAVPVQPLAFEQKIQRLQQIARRNFLLYSALGKQLGARVVFVLQPFLSWTRKTVSEDEKNVMDFLLTTQEGTAWRENYEILKRKETHEAILGVFEAASEEFGIPVLDANPRFNTPDTLFVDHVHLNDQGAAIAADIVLEGLEL
jgi:lysophospholipase L1-like esterase